MAGLTRASPGDVGTMEKALARLMKALLANRSEELCLRRWSEFVRLRDGRCVDCHSSERLSAHHVSRKTLFRQGRFDPGNGITLCPDCHREAHEGFNGRPDHGLPIDAQGGEKLPLMARFFSILLDDAVERGLLRDDFYYVGDALLASFRQMQGYSAQAYFPGCRLEQAFLILSEPEHIVRNAILSANGFASFSEPLSPGAMMFFSDNDGDYSELTLFRGYRPRSD